MYLNFEDLTPLQWCTEMQLFVSQRLLARAHNKVAATSEELALNAWQVSSDPWQTARVLMLNCQRTRCLLLSFGEDQWSCYH